MHLQAAPAMNTAMWDHPLTAQQLAVLTGFGWQIIDPIAKQLACGDVGLGAMQEPSAIADAVGRASHEYLMRPIGFSHAGQPQVGFFLKEPRLLADEHYLGDERGVSLYVHKFLKV